jgi:hypothetical protein
VSRQRCRRVDRGTVCACKRVEADGPKGVCVAGRAATTPTGWELTGFLIKGFDECSTCHNGELSIEAPRRLVEARVRYQRAAFERFTLHSRVVFGGGRSRG